MLRQTIDIAVRACFTCCRSDGQLDTRLTQMFPGYSRRDLMRLSVTICPRATKYAHTYISVLPQQRRTRHAGERNRSFATEWVSEWVSKRERRFYKGRYCGPAYRPSDHGEYRLLAATADKPNVSHSFVSKSNRKQAAGCHLAPLSSRLVAPPACVPRVYLALTNSPFRFSSDKRRFIQTTKKSAPLIARRFFRGD